MVLNLKVVECRKYCVFICLLCLIVIICICKRNKYFIKVDMLNFVEVFEYFFFFYMVKCFYKDIGRFG